MDPVLEFINLPRGPITLRRGRYVVGSDAEAGLAIDALGVDARHAEVSWDGVAVLVRDLGSSTGTRLNGIPAGTAWSEAEPGSQITFGPVVVRVVLEPGAPQAGQQAGPAVAGNLVVATDSGIAAGRDVQLGGRRATRRGRLDNAIFISYRRSDSADEVAALHRHLETVLGQGSVFRDLDAIRAGDRLTEVIDSTLRNCDVVLVVIGPGWVSASDTRGFRRLDDPYDYVRLEVERSLAMNKRVVPVLVNEAPLPTRSELPASIVPVVDNAAAKIRSGPAFEIDATRLIADLEPDL